MSRYPRVLVTAHNAFNRSHSNSLTLSSLFDGWPAERLAQVYVPFLTPVPPAFDVCRRFWALTPLGLREVREAEADALPAPRPPSAPRRSLMRLADRPVARKVAYPIREWMYSRRSLLKGAPMEEIRRFAPEVVFSMLGSLSMLRLSLRLADDLGAVLVPYVTDDWISTEYRGAFGERRLRGEMERAFARVLEEAPVRLVISPSMAEEYARRYGGEFLPFNRCIDAAAFPETPPVRRGEGEPVELLYAGQVGAGRWEYLRKIGEALADLAAEGVHGRLTIYTVPAHAELHREALTLEPVMRLAGHVESHRLPAVYQGADVLVMAESFDPQWAAYTALSLSTKVSEYLMAGRAVLGVGPELQGSMRHLAESGGGVVVGDPSPEALRAALRSLLADPERRLAMGRRGHAFALEHHECARQQERFRAVLARAAVSGPRAPSSSSGRGPRPAVQRR
jgi:glycosyltransferase involved in cell wall biosynthesis